MTVDTTEAIDAAVATVAAELDKILAARRDALALKMIASGEDLDGCVDPDALPEGLAGLALSFDGVLALQLAIDIQCRDAMLATVRANLREWVDEQPRPV